MAWHWCMVFYPKRTYTKHAIIHATISCIAWIYNIILELRWHAPMSSLRVVFPLPPSLLFVLPMAAPSPPRPLGGGARAYCCHPPTRDGCSLAAELLPARRVIQCCPPWLREPVRPIQLVLFSEGGGVVTLHIEGLLKIPPTAGLNGLVQLWESYPQQDYKRVQLWEYYPQLKHWGQSGGTVKTPVEIFDLRISTRSNK